MNLVQFETGLNFYGVAIADEVSAMLAYWDNDLVCRYANAAYVEWFGKTSKELIGKVRLIDLLGEDIYSRIEHHIRGVLSGEKQTFEQAILAPGNKVRYSCISYYPNIVNGKVTGYYVHGADITAQKSLERELFRSNEIIGQQNKQLLNFANIISHNLNTYAFNLAAILDFYAAAGSEDEKNQLFSHLRNISNGFSSTIENLKEIVCIQNNGGIKYSWVNLHGVVTKCKDVLINQLKRNDGLVFNLVDSKMKLWANAAYMDSIIMNFLTNAVKYSHPDRRPEITITASTRNRELILNIADNGLGIDLEKNGRNLFGMYKTFHGNKDAQGIGLFITKFQIEALGGRVEVDSVINTGTTFTIYFPVTDPVISAA